MTHTLRTYDTEDDTSTGFAVRLMPDRIVATYRSRWQGSRDAVRISISAAARDWTPSTIEELVLAAWEAASLATGWRYTRGAYGRALGHPYKITSSGYTVQ